MSASVLDRLIGWVSPHAGLSRHFARQRLSRAYEAASPRDTWRPRRAGASANADHQADAAALRVKARFLVQNVPYIRAGMDALVSYTIGTGIMPRATGLNATRINDLFAQWVKVCDADGRLDFFGIQAAAYRAMEQDGEVLIRLRQRRSTDGLPVPLQLQVLEIDWLDSTRNGTEAGNQITNGVETDFLGRTVAYWLWDQHPGDVTIRRGTRTQSRRVLAMDIVHLFDPQRPGQGRGFTRLAPIIPRVRDTQLYEDAELARKNLETRLSVLYSGDASELRNPAADGSPGAGEAASTGNLGELGSGSILGMPPGGQFEVIEPKAAPGHVEYVKHQLHVIAAGMGVTYEMLTGDMAEVNFSSARVRLLQFRTAVEQMRWLVVIPRLIEPLWRAFINAAQLDRKIEAADYRVDYSTPKWDYVNPEQDVKADALEISVGLSSLSEKLRQRGYKPADVISEIASDFEALRKSGVLDILLFLQKGSTMEAPAQAAAAAARESERQAERQRDIAIAAARAVPPASVTVNQGDTVVNERSVTVEAPQVNVAPAAVTVEGARVSVEQPAAAPAAVPAELQRMAEEMPELLAQMERSLAQARAPRPPMQVVHEIDPVTQRPTRSYLAPMEPEGAPQPTKE